MSEQEFERYLSMVAGNLSLSASQRQAIRRELRSHLEEGLEDARAQGIPREEAIARALRDFGDAGQLGRAMTRPYRVRMLRRGAVALASAACLTLILHVRDGSLWPGKDRPAGLGAAEELDFVTAQAGGPTRHASRGRELPSGRLATAQPRDAAGHLDELVPEFRVDAMPLEQVVDSLRDLGQVSIWVNWPAVEGVAIARDYEISASLKQVTVGRILQLICAELSAKAGQGILFGVAGNVVEISTAEHLSAPRAAIGLVQRVYDVRDLVGGAEPADPPGRGGYGGYGGEAGRPYRRATGRTGAFGASPFPTPPGISELIELMLETIDPGAWQVQGGAGPAAPSISHFDGALVVRAMPGTQAQVAELLEQLRATLAGPERAAATQPAACSYTDPPRSGDRR